MVNHSGGKKNKKFKYEKPGQKLSQHEQEYLAFLSYLYREYMESRVIRDILHDNEWDPESLRMELGNLCKAVNLIKYGLRENPDEEGMYKIFCPEKLNHAVEQVDQGLQTSKQMSEDLGIVECLEAHYGDIVEGLSLKFFPDEDFKVLKQAGSQNPQEDLLAWLYILKKRHKTEDEGPWADRELIREDYLHASAGTKRESKNSKEWRSRRWFKGLGQMGQGAALTIANLALAMDVLGFKVAPETQTWGALVSATTGVGMICIGFGELRGE